MLQILENTNLNLLIDTMDLICIKFHFFFKVAHVSSQNTHFSLHYLDLFGSTLKSMDESLNIAYLIVYYTYDTTDINISLGRSTSNFINIDSQPIVLVKTTNHPLLPFLKGLIRKVFFLEGQKYFLVKGIMTRILVLTRWFIYNDTKKCIMESQDRSSKYTLQFFFVLDPCVVNKNNIHK